jgi:ACS family glucarate transporter-like MFS transporter
MAVVKTPETTSWIPEPVRQRILAERHGHEPVIEGDGIGYPGLMRSPSMWGLAISQGCAVYSVYLYLSWLPNYLQTQRGLSIVNSGLATAVPFLIGGAIIIVTNWIGDKTLTPATMGTGARRNVAVACLLLCALGSAIPYTGSLTLVVILSIFPIAFGGTATGVNAALTNDLLRSKADSGRAFAFLVLGGNVFGLTAPIITGYIVQLTGSFSSAFILAGALSLIGAAVSYGMTRHTLGEVVPSYVAGAAAVTR